jgi:hypothetical protein
MLSRLQLHPMQMTATAFLLFSTAAQITEEDEKQEIVAARLTDEERLHHDTDNYLHGSTETIPEGESRYERFQKESQEMREIALGLHALRQIPVEERAAYLHAAALEHSPTLVWCWVTETPALEFMRADDFQTDQVIFRTGPPPYLHINDVSFSYRY